ncbi:hypothetical protein PR048_017598 [Dryococelus australis]|uniref:Uncharacterized protein n=1 Tax=Dryococelus australis TaxID=614101 RepID=A0ABQ9HA73_9NEOP|nr:hypothetical protein PR048_017598 [Dryococelus australis]
MGLVDKADMQLSFNDRCCKSVQWYKKFFHLTPCVFRSPRTGFSPLHSNFHHLPVTEVKLLKNFVPFELHVKLAPLTHVATVATICLQHGSGRMGLPPQQGLSGMKVHNIEQAAQTNYTTKVLGKTKAVGGTGNCSTGEAEKNCGERLHMLPSRRSETAMDELRFVQWLAVSPWNHNMASILCAYCSMGHGHWLHTAVGVTP